MAVGIESTLHAQIRPILGSLRATATGHAHPHPGTPPPVLPFITIAREAGAGGWSLAKWLVEHFNKTAHEDARWTCWDRELVEKVANDNHISTQLVESLGETRHSWLDDFIEGITISQAGASEIQVCRRMAGTIRTLALAGRVVIVGVGGVFITRSMPGGTHIRLVAPLDWRIDFMARKLNCDHAAAADYVKRTEANRAAFFKRYWAHASLEPTTFDATYNTAMLSEEQLVASVAALVNAKSKVPVR